MSGWTLTFFFVADFSVEVFAAAVAGIARSVRAPKVQEERHQWAEAGPTALTSQMPPVKIDYLGTLELGKKRNDSVGKCTETKVNYFGFQI